MDGGAPFPDGVPAQVDGELVGHDEVGPVAAEVEVELRRRPEVVVGVEGDAHEVAQAVVVAVPDEAVHELGARVLAIDADVDVLVVIEKLDPRLGRRDGPLVGNDLHEPVGPRASPSPNLVVEPPVDDWPLPL